MQYDIANWMSIGIIDMLEMIEVRYYDTKLAIFPIASFQLLKQATHDCCPVPHTG
jgi:hypothetical protein